MRYTVHLLPLLVIFAALLAWVLIEARRADVRETRETRRAAEREQVRAAARARHDALFADVLDAVRTRSRT